MRFLRETYCGSIAVVPGSITEYTADKSGTFVPILGLDCNDLEPLYFDPRLAFVAEAANSDTIFFNIKLDEGDWRQDDEADGNSVRIYDVVLHFERAQC